MGLFWIGFGILQLLMATGTIPPNTGSTFPALGFWFIALAAITIMGTMAATDENLETPTESWGLLPRKA